MTDYPIRYDGQHFASRRALARHLAALLGSTENACKHALARCDDDPAAVLANHLARAERFSFDGLSFATQHELAMHIAPLAGRAVQTTLNLLGKFGGDAARVIAHFQAADDISAFGALGQELRLALREEGYTRLDDLTVLTPQVDPYRHDTPTGRASGAWFRDLFIRLVPSTIHLRGFHYTLVAVGGITKPDGTPYINDFENWLWLQMEASSAARWLGMVPFERILDERNERPILPTDPEHAPGFVRELTAGESMFVPHFSAAMPKANITATPARQPYRIVLFGEKTSLGSVLRPIRERINGELLLPTGESTTTMVFDMAWRAALDGRPCVIFYFSDFDPAGWQMSISVARKLQAIKTLRFPNLDVQLFPVALNYDQVSALNLPSTTLKPEEKRADKWRAAWNHEQTEIDALATLNPSALTTIAEAAVAPFWDPTLVDRTERELERARRAAAATLASRPQWQSAQARIENALAAVEDAVADLEAIQDEVADEWADIELPDLPELPEPELKDEPPEPLFNSGDGYITATLKLKRHRALYEDDAEASDRC
jgi:hypothetical protein